MTSDCSHRTSQVKDIKHVSGTVLTHTRGGVQHNNTWIGAQKLSILTYNNNNNKKTLEKFYICDPLFAAASDTNALRM